MKIQFVPLEQPAQARHIPAAEQPAHGFDVEEKPAPAFLPDSRTIAGQSAAGDQTVEVIMAGELLTPGVQHRRDAGLDAQIVLGKDWRLPPHTGVHGS